ncbi:MAG TPA: hypothetical protein VE890_16620, partial [Thermoguttaceae bacterium]|nr:hypothetical protein [Thermoguttaceae bacterium]
MSKNVASIRLSALLLSSLLVSALLLSAGSALAADPEWYVPQDTWVETYLASINELCRLELEQGTAVPDVKNDAKLPVVLYPEWGRELLDVQIDVDVSRVKQLYLGSNRPSRLAEAVLIRSDGTKQPLFENDELTVPYTLTDDRGQVNVGRDMEVREAELALSLDENFIRLVTKVRIYDTSIFWIDTESHFRLWQRTSHLRGDVRRYAERVLYERYEDRDVVEAVKRQLSSVDAGMPSGLRPVSIDRAAAQFEAAILQRYGNNVDPRVVGAFETMAAQVKSEKDFERLVRMSFALSNYRSFQYHKGRSTGTEECPGVAEAFKAIEDEVFQLDPDRFDYGAGLAAKFEAFDNLVEECKRARQYVQIAYDTIDYVDPVAPVSQDARTRLAALAEELEANKNSLKAYLATRDKIRKLRRAVLFSHPALDFDQILINRNPPPSYSHNGDQHLGRHSRLGKGLTILSDWKSDHPRVTTPLQGKLPEGAIRNPDLAFDAEKVVFAFCDHTVEPANLRRFLLYEAALDGS